MENKRDPHKLMFIDISKAYLHADVINHDLYVELPKEMNMPDKCGWLKKALYGTRDGAKCWENDYAAAMVAQGFKRGRSSACLFRNEKTGSMSFVHGDDFVVSGPESHLLELKRAIGQKYKAKVRAVLGPNENDDKSVIILGRVVEWKSHGVDLEADPRHAELILKEMGMDNCMGSDVVGRAGRAEEDDVELDPAEATKFRSIAARCNFLAADRIDLQFACKEVCRRMSTPCASDWQLLKGLARYLRSHPRMLLSFAYQKPPECIAITVDSDFAGCKRTRKSTNGGYAMHGHHLIKSWSTTQTVVAMSSGEAEHYGAVKGACEGIGIAGLVWDLTGRHVKLEVSTDSSAARGIAMRRGVGKVRHLEVRTLWLQDQVDRGIVKINKVSGQTNPADVCTKYLEGRRMQELLEQLPLHFTAGRHSLVPELQGAQS